MSFRSTLYVGNVAYSSKESDLANLFANFGTVLSTDIKRGFAFVKFEAVDSAQAAVDALDSTIFNGRNLRVNFSKSEPHPSHNNANPNAPSSTPQAPPPFVATPRVPYKENSIHVANLPYFITEETLHEIFSNYGIVSLHILRTRNCFAIIELSSEENTNKAIEQKKGLVIEGREIVVSKQVELPERHVNFHARGRGRGRGRGNGRGFHSRGGSYRRPDYHHQPFQSFVLHNNLHNPNLNNGNINNNNNNGNANNSNGNNLINLLNNNNNNASFNNEAANNENNNPIHNNNKRGDYHSRGSYRYRGDIFRGRGSFGRGSYRSRGSSYRSRGRGFRGRNNHFNPNHHNNNNANDGNNLQGNQE